MQQEGPLKGIIGPRKDCCFLHPVIFIFWNNINNSRKQSARITENFFQKLFDGGGGDRNFTGVQKATAREQ